MKIIRDTKTMDFKDIPVGGVFQTCNTVKTAYIKIDTLYDQFNCDGNAINLMDGTLYYCDDDEKLLYYPNAVLKLKE